MGSTQIEKAIRFRALHIGPGAFVIPNPWNSASARKHLQAFERAGADVLFAPGLPDLDSVRTVCAALSKPFNFMTGIKAKSFSAAELVGANPVR